jgi:hypothetical protein
MIKIREYQKGDIFKLYIDNVEKSMLQFINEKQLIDNIAFTGIDGISRVVGCGGVILMWPGVYESWIALDENRKKEHISILKMLKQILDGLPNIVRIQAHVSVNIPNHEKFMKFLGFEKEAILKLFFPNRDDGVLYRRLYDTA